jgi:5-methylcytosine-specific restriction enzyme subunit McrC
MRISKFLCKNLQDNSGERRTWVGRRPPATVILEDGNGSDNLLRATRFIRLVEERVATALDEGGGLICQFGEDFDFSRDQTFIHVTGEGFHESVSIVTGNIIGTVLGQVDAYFLRLCVTSRFGDLFLHHMIASSEGFVELENFGTPPASGDADWLLWFLWKVRLKSAFIAGLPKLYSARADSLPLVRGNLDLNAWLRLPANLGQYPCRFREHSYDNPVTRLINETFHYLTKEKTGARELIADMQPIRNAFREACSDRSRDVQGEAAGIRNPYFAAYNEVVRLSQLILGREASAIGMEKEEFSALLFDVSLLFENYVRKILRNGRLSLESRGSGDAIYHPTGSRPMEMRPDIIVHGPTRTLVLDVKYKVWENWRFSRGSQRADLFQVISYAAAQRGRCQDLGGTFGYGLVFPTKNPNQTMIRDRFVEIDMDFFIFFLCVPTGEACDFGDQMNKYEGRLVEEVRSVAGYADCPVATV